MKRILFLIAIASLAFSAPTYADNPESIDLEVGIYDPTGNLQNVPAPFEPGIPNFYDTVVFSQEYNLSFTPTHVLIAIEDSEGVYDNLPFCNTIESLPQEQNTGRYYLL